MITRRTALLLPCAVAAQDAWESLFDGSSFAGWTLGDGAAVTHSWTIEAGAIATIAGTRGRSDLICSKPFREFELEFEFRLSPGSNTGLKYFVQHSLRYLYPGSSLSGSYGAVGMEFQLADDASNSVPGPEQKMGALYGILPARQPAGYKTGEWASARLVCRGSGCEHWVNGRRLLAYNPTEPGFLSRLREVALDPRHSIVGAAAAQVAARRKTGEMPPALIALQQHDSKAWFRALRARQLA